MISDKEMRLRVLAQDSLFGTIYSDIYAIFLGLSDNDFLTICYVMDGEIPEYEEESEILLAEIAASDLYFSKHEIRVISKAEYKSLDSMIPDGCDFGAYMKRDESFFLTKKEKTK